MANAYRFTRAMRVRSSKDFDLAFSSGRRASCAAMLVVARENGLLWSRLGLSTGRKFGPAHRRNRARRLLREAFRLEQESIPAGFDFIVVPRAGDFPDHTDAVRELVKVMAERAIHGRRNQPRPPRRGRRK